MEGLGDLLLCDYGVCLFSYSLYLPTKQTEVLV